MKHLLRTVFAFVLTILIGSIAIADGSNSPPVVIDYFYEAGCADCFRVKQQIMPELKERFEGFYMLNRYDVGLMTNVIRLASYQKKLGIAKNEPVCMVVDYKHVFNGFSAMKTGLLERIDECIAERMEPGWQPPKPIVVRPGDEAEILAERVKGFTLSAVIAAGFVDGLNPCAISTLVFFMSLLAVAKVKGRGLLLMGCSFCLASFVAYTALGFGLLRALYLLSGFEVFRFGVEVVMMALLGVFAFLSFRDALRYRASGNPADVSLQLPDSIKTRIHGIMRSGLSAKSMALGGLIIGTAVTALESVCTGQMYVPTLVMVIKSGKSVPVALRYLLLYNIMFMVPLVTVFVLTYFGLRTETLINWSRKNVVISKVLLGILFLALAAFLVIL